MLTSAPCILVPFLNLVCKTMWKKNKKAKKKKTKKEKQRDFDDKASLNFKIVPRNPVIEYFVHVKKV